MSKNDKKIKKNTKKMIKKLKKTIKDTLFLKKKNKNYVNSNIKLFFNQKKIKNMYFLIVLI